MEPQASRGPGTGFNRLWAAFAASNLADGIGMTALILLGAALTRDPVLVSAITALVFLPWLILGIPSGVLVDRVDRRRAIAGANGARVLVSAALGVLVVTDQASIVAVLVAAFLLGACETVADNASNAVVPRLVHPDGLVRANSRIQGTEVVAQVFVGAPLAGVLFTVAAALPFVVHSTAFAIAAVLVLTLPVAAARADSGSVVAGADSDGPARVSAWASIREGVGFLLGHRVLRGLWFASAALGFLGTMAQAILVLFVLDELRLPESAFGLFLSAAAVGAVVGAVLAEPVAARLGRGPAMTVSVVVTGLAFAGIGLSSSVVPAGAAFAASAAGISLWNVLSMAARQTIVPGVLMGRVHGAWRTLGWGVMPLGALVGGVLGRLDVRLPLLVGGALMLLVGTLIRPTLRRLPPTG